MPSFFDFINNACSAPFIRAFFACRLGILRFRSKSAKPNSPNFCGVHLFSRAMDGQRFNFLEFRRNTGIWRFVGFDELCHRAFNADGTRRFCLGFSRKLSDSFKENSNLVCSEFNIDSCRLSRISVARSRI